MRDFCCANACRVIDRSAKKEYTNTEYRKGVPAVKIKILALLLTLSLLLCGCMDIASYLQPPHPGGQQQAVHEALTHALSRGEAGDTYTLKYASVNNNSSAFVMLSADGTLTPNDDAVLAVAFYAPRSGERVHLALLRRNGNDWEAVADVQGEGTDLHTASVADLDNDGTVELLLGWNLFSKEYQLSIYRLDDTMQAVKDAGRYTFFLIGDMNADAKEEILLLLSGTTATATLCRYDGNSVSTMDTVVLREGVRAFEKVFLGYTTGSGNGVYMDVKLVADTYATLLVYWDGKKLCAPLFDAKTGNAAIADRIPAVSLSDVDGNGVPEIPVTTRLADGGQATPQETWRWLTEWYTWDVTTHTAVRQSSGIVNRADGYCLELEDAWTETVVTRYDADTYTLWLEYMTPDGVKPFLAVQNTASLRNPVSPSPAHTFEMLPGNLPLKIWFDNDTPFNLTTEKISYMLVGL